MFLNLLHKVVTFTFVLLFAVNTAVDAQKTLANNHLLWKISGNGITTASYLYVVIPSNDKRIYELADSVYWAFDQCEAVAVEIAPDSLKTALFERYFKESKPNKRLKDILPEGTYRSFSQKLYGSVGYTLDQTSISNPAFLNNLASRKINIGHFDYVVKQTDYFARLAETEQKPVISLETLQEKVELNLYTDFETDEILSMGINEYDLYRLYTDSTFGEELIALYKKGDLDGYLKKIDPGGNIAEREQATHNHIMAERLKSFLTTKSMFISVSIQVAGGEAGLLALLKNMGFVLSPVGNDYSENQGSNYLHNYAPDKLPWPVQVSERFGYSVAFPGKVEQETIRGSISESFYCNDPASKANYFAVIIQNPLDSIADDVLLQHILERSERIPKTSQLSSNKPIQAYFEGDTIHGIEITFSQNRHSYNRIRIYVREKQYIYFFVVETRKEEVLWSKAATQFLNNVEFTALPKQKKEDWKNFVWKEAACSFKVLGTPDFTESFEDPTNEGSARDFGYSFSNPTDGSSFIIHCSELENGMSYQDSIVMFSEWEFNIRRNTKVKLIRKKELSDSSCIAREYEIEDPINKGIYRIFYRGNKFYLIMITYRKEGHDSLAVADFLNSFSFMPFGETKLVSYTALSKDYSLLIPEGQTLIERKQYTYRERRKSAFNLERFTEPKSGIVFQLGRCNTPAYAYFPSEDSLKSWIESNVLEETDSLLWAKPVLHYSPYEVLDLGICPKNPVYFVRARIYLVGNTFHLLQAFTAPNDLNSNLVEAIFNSFQIKNASPFCAPTLYSRKEVLDNLFKDFEREVLLKKRRAYQSSICSDFLQFPFQESDLPYFYQAISKINPKDTAAAQLLSFYLQKLPDSIEIDSFIPLLADLYDTNFLREKSSIQNRILLLLSKSESDMAKAEFKNLLLENTPKIEQPYETQPLGLYKDLKLKESAYLFPELLLLLNDKSQRSWLIPFLAEALDNSIIEGEDLSLYWYDLESEFAKLCKKIPQYDASVYDENYLQKLESLIDLINLFKHKPALSKQEIRNLQDLLKLSDETFHPAYKIDLIGTLLKHHIRPNQKAIDVLSSELTFCSELYRPYQKYQKTKWFPKKHRNQPDMASSKMMQWLNEYEEFSFDKLEILETRQVTINGKKGKIYFFKITEENWDLSSKNNRWYLGACGLYLHDNDLIGDGFHPEFDWESLEDGSEKIADKKADLLKRLELQE